MDFQMKRYVLGILGDITHDFVTMPFSLIIGSRMGSFISADYI
jgi:hypothetical protein